MSAAATGSVTIEAPAKINLYLHVVGRRSNGYHELESLIAFTDEFDVLTLESSHELTLEIDGTFAYRLPTSDDNLVLRAARALGKAAGATLRGLAQLWDIDTSKIDLKEVGLGLGTDIPACLVSDTVHVGGVGENLQPGPVLPDAGIVLVNPGVTLSTPSVFQARRGGFSPNLPMMKSPANLDVLVRELEDRSNDLTEPALRLAPVIREVLVALEAMPGCRLARLSGSGATCFGLFDDPAAAAAAAADLKVDGWWVRPTRFRTSGA
jgi:4-diphosphocytidyl-2-C-methyl-D-erythritol kinase